MTAPAVTIYTTGFCGYCLRALALLRRRGVAFTEISVDDQPRLRSELLSRSDSRTLPQIFIADRYVGGATELAVLERSGELDRLLAEGKQDTAVSAK